MTNAAITVHIHKLSRTVSECRHLLPCSGISVLQVKSSKDKLEARLQKTTEPLDYSTSLRLLRDAIQKVEPAPVVVAEGANTMDNARCVKPPPGLGLNSGLSPFRLHLQDPHDLSQ